MKQSHNQSIAVLGKGKTGAKVIELLNQNGIEPIIFDSKTPPCRDLLQNIKYMVAFVPSNVLLSHTDLLIDQNISLVSGATGMPFSPEISAKLIEKKLTWISGSNFSLGMRVIYQLMNTIKKAKDIWPVVDISIHEVHHTKKLDGPSGTALSWADWVGLEDKSSVSFERTGDVVGDHKLSFNTGDELITIRHQALDRKLFAQGAIWALNQVRENKIEPGLHLFEDITKDLF